MSTFQLVSGLNADIRADYLDGPGVSPEAMYETIVRLMGVTEALACKIDDMAPRHPKPIHVEARTIEYRQNESGVRI